MRLWWLWPLALLYGLCYRAPTSVMDLLELVVGTWVCLLPPALVGFLAARARLARGPSRPGGPPARSACSPPTSRGRGRP